MIGRMYSVSPKDVERFHMRLLLLHVRGANSYEDLWTVNGYLADLYQNVDPFYDNIVDRENENRW